MRYVLRPSHIGPELIFETAENYGPEERRFRTVIARFADVIGLVAFDVQIGFGETVDIVDYAQFKLGTGGTWTVFKA
jgi:hypothetical protein